MFFAVYYEKLHSYSCKDSLVILAATKNIFEHTKLITRVEMRFEVVISDVILFTIWVQSFGIRMDFKTKKAELLINFEM